VAPFDLDPQVGVSAGYYDVRETNTLSRLARKFFGVDLTKINPQEFLPSGRSLAFQKKLWEKAGGYPEWLTDAGEDTLFDIRLKAQPARWAFVPSARAAWYAPDTFRKLLKTYYRYSRGDGETGIGAELYWFKIVELLRVWPRRIVMLIAGFLLVDLWPLVGVLFFGTWLAWSILCLWRRNRSYSNTLGVRFYPGTILLEVVGIVQAIGFTLGVSTRQKVRLRETKYYQTKITELIEQYPDRKGIIVYPPTHDWGFMFQRPHQIARAFSQQGWIYFFCTANSRADAVFGFQEVEPGLVLSHVPEDTFRILKNPVVYLGSAWNRSYLEYFDAPKVVYDHYDDLVVSGANQDDHMALINEADIVLVTAQRLLDTVHSLRDDALLIPNGVDYDFINSVRPQTEIAPPDDMLPILTLGQPIVGYSGALAEWFDYDLLARAARKYVTYSFVLVGVDYDGSLERSGLLDFPNIFYLGMKKYVELFEYVWRFDIALIPFKVNDITLATSPVKMYEYMACKKPVVVTDLPECRTFSEIFLAENDSQFVSLIFDAMQQKDNIAFQGKLEKLAQENTWNARVEKISYSLLTKM
jgi:glycosyltransferase involved in cell wall biosynthesis